MEKGKPLHLYFILITLALFNCNTTEPPINGKEITLKLEDVSCTEAWISLTTTNLQIPAIVTLKQDNQTKSAINLIKADSLLYIDALLPNTNYQFQAELSGIQPLARRYHDGQHQPRHYLANVRYTHNC